MEIWSKILTKIVIGLISILDASNLRSRLYDIKEEHEIMWTALDDIARMYKEHPSGSYAKRVLEKIKQRYTR